MTGRELRILRALRRHGGEMNLETLELELAGGRADLLDRAVRSLHRQELIVVDAGMVAITDAGLEIVEAMTP